MPEMEYVASTNVEAIGYDAETQELHVQFTSGHTYIYSPVEEWVFEELRAAPSKGSFINRELKGRYEYRQE